MVFAMYFQMLRQLIYPLSEESNLNRTRSGILLMKPELLQKAKDEWKKKMQGRVYKSPLPAALKPPLDQLEKQ